MTGVTRNIGAVYGKVKADKLLIIKEISRLSRAFETASGRPPRGPFGAPQSGAFPRPPVAGIGLSEAQSSDRVLRDRDVASPPGPATEEMALLYRLHAARGIRINS